MKRKVYVETSVISYLTACPRKTIIGVIGIRPWFPPPRQRRLFSAASEVALVAACASVHWLTFTTRNVNDCAHVAIPLINPFAN